MALRLTAHVRVESEQVAIELIQEVNETQRAKARSCELQREG